MQIILLRWVALAFLLSTLNLQPSTLFAQGSLTPPGAPAPTMKSLDQIEARTPISSLPFTISTSGSYYLAKSLNIASGNAITIAVSGVTVDLNGFEITSTESSPAHTGILVNGGLSNIRIMNGQIRGNVTVSGSTFSGAGFANGIQTTGAATTNAHVSDVSVAGCLSNGIYLGSGLVESCTVSVIGGTGIYADNVLYCNSYNCGSVGISANYNVTGCVAITAPPAFCAIQGGGTVTGCYASGHPSTSQAVIEAQVARDCWAIATSGTGDALYANTAENCNGFAYGTGVGVHCYNTAINCYGTSSGASDALSALTAENCNGFASGTGSGIHCSENAVNCYGTNITTASTNAAAAVNVGGTALNCYGVSSGTGAALQTNTAENCYAVANGSGYGLGAASALNCKASAQNTGMFTTTAMNCVGSSSNGGDGISAVIATSCSGNSMSGVAINCNGGIIMSSAGLTTSGTGIYAYMANSSYGTANQGTGENVGFKYNMPF